MLFEEGIKVAQPVYTAIDQTFTKALTTIKGVKLTFVNLYPLPVLQAVIYYLSLPFLYLLSWLPSGLLYAVSDFVYLILYRVLGYRKDVVMNNLRRSFPEKTETELNVIADRFYRHLCDLFLETFKTLTISRKEMLRRCEMSAGAKKIFDDLAAANQSCIILMGHQGQWEWGGNTFSLLCRHRLYVIYHPLANKYFNGLMYRMRTRFGTGLIAMKDTFRDMTRLRQELTATAFIADQSPTPETAYWTTFLHQDSGFFQGAEKIARKMNRPVVYIQVYKKRRGYYELRAEELCANPGSSADGEVLEAYIQKLQQDIYQQPETWLWSHRRWKHRRPQKIQLKETNETR